MAKFKRTFDQSVGGPSSHLREMTVTKKAELRKSSYPCAANGYELDLTAGCDVGCIYCALSQSRSYELLDVRGLLEGPIPPRGIYVSPNSDPFSEKAKEAAHCVLEKYLSAGVSIVLFTKHKIPPKTVQLFGKYPRSLIPTISLARLDEELNSYIEPGGASVRERLDVIKALADSGLRVKARLCPVFPGVDDSPEQLEEIIEAYARAGVYAVKAAYAVVRNHRITAWMVKKLTDHPVLRLGWQQMSETIRIYLGKGNVPPLERRLKFYADVKNLCQKYRLKFAACSTLDFPLKKEKPKSIPVCSNIMTFYRGYIPPDGFIR